MPQKIKKLTRAEYIEIALAFPIKRLDSVAAMASHWWWSRKAIREEILDVARFLEEIVEIEQYLEEKKKSKPVRKGKSACRK